LGGGTVDEIRDHLVDMFRKQNGPVQNNGIPIDQEFANYVFFFVGYCFKEIFKKHHLQFQMTTFFSTFLLKGKTL